MRLQTQVEPEIQKRLLLSRVEAESLKERDILCPTCGFRIQRVFSDAVAHLTAMDMTMKCPHSSIKNLPLCLTTRLKEQRKKGLNWKEKNCVSVKSGKQG